MLHQQVSRANLAALGAAAAAAAAANVGAVELGHVDLELLGIGALGRLPARLLLFRVEVVRQVLGVAVADFPVGRETSVGFLHENQTGGCDLASSQA